MLFAFLAPIAIQAQQTTEDETEQPIVYPSFLPSDSMPDATIYLPAPPDTASMNYMNDWVQYNWGKSLRNTPRGQQAIFDDCMKTDSILKCFSLAAGRELSSEKTPAVFYLIERVTTAACDATMKAKESYKRKRPYVQFNEGTLVPEEEASHWHSGSYPSSHSATGWAIALVLAELMPESQNAILKRGFDYGQSRVIAGYHYQSDVDLARLAGAAAIARLHADKGFQKAMKKAAKELKE